MAGHLEAQVGYTFAFVVSLLSSVLAVTSLCWIKEGKRNEKSELEMRNVQGKEDTHPACTETDTAVEDENFEKASPLKSRQAPCFSPSTKPSESKFRTWLATFRSDLQSGVACFCQKRESRYLRTILLLIGLSWMIEDACNVKYEHFYPYLRLLMGPSLIDYGYYRSFLGIVGITYAILFSQRPFE